MRAPSFETRRRKELQEELLTRARAWLRDWHPRDEGDFAVALLKIAARIESEVTQRLDRAPEKTFLAFLDWLGVKGKPGLAARLPVVFTMTPGSEPVDAPARVQLQVNSADTPVNFETENPLRILPGELDTLVAADPAKDKFFLPPPGLFTLEAPAQVPTVWTVRSPAALAATSLQLDPAAGLDAGITIGDPDERMYRVTGVNGAIVTIEPPLESALDTGVIVRRLDTFNPFGDLERNRQEHALYIGASDALSIEAEATIGIKNGASIPPDAKWWYSGKPSPARPDGWVPLGTVTVDGADLVIAKPKGAIETLKIEGRNSRWLKATREPGATESSHATGLRLLINCLDDPDKIKPVTALEGIANTTPLVVDAGFYPFGREPRQFDSFYIGSKEAFSKPQAEAILTFSLGARVKNAHAAIGFSDSMYGTVGISEDGRLQRTLHLVSAGRPGVLFGSATQPTGSDHRPIKLSDSARPGAALFQGIPVVSASAGSEVWVWKQGGAGDEWLSLGTPYTAPDGKAPDVKATMLVRRGLQLIVYAISGGRLHMSVVGSNTWSEAFKLADPAQILTVAPVVKATGRAGDQDEADGIVIVSDLKEMWLNVGGTWSLVGGGPAEVDPDFYPLVVLTSAGRLGLVRDGTDARPRAFNLGTNGAGYTASLDVVGHAADFKPIPGGILFVLTAVDGNKPAAAYVWDAFANESPIADESSGRQLVEGPLFVGKSNGTSFFYFAGEEGQAFILPIGQIQTVTGASVADAITFTDTVNDWTLKDKGFPIDLDPNGTAGRTIAFVDKVYRGSAAGTWVLQVNKLTDSVLTSAPITLYTGKHDALRSGQRTAPRTLELAGDDAEAVKPGFMYVNDGTDERVLAIDTVTPAAGGTQRLVTFPATGPALPAGPTIQYKCLDAPGVNQTASVHPLVGTGGLDPGVEAALATATLEFTGVTPASQIVSDILLGPHLAVLQSPWTTGPATATVSFVAKVKLFDAWELFEPPKPRNPTLSWEYFDSTAWRLIPNLDDGTDNLAKGGDVKFCVPRDLQPTDVAGRKNHWIRARLVGGDYGEATVTVTTKPGSAKDTTVQTVDRNTDSIRAPYIASLTVKYRVCCPVTPEFVLARDNGGVIDQTNVNRSASAVVDYFVPLSVALSAAAGDDPTAGAEDRALYLGFDTALSGGPIQILFLVEESVNDSAYPLRVDALTNNRFTPLAAIVDNTRGLNESGTLEINLAESPRQTGLFGAPRFWLRVRPGPSLTDQTKWTPKIRAAYLNATWATAADTQLLEPLGSSDGSPRQQFVLARPPVIEGSLELRVLERLGDEEVDALRKIGRDIRGRLPNVPARPGVWVLWTQVDDPADAGPGERVYGLDDAKGVITFGDGSHGMIPPIGTDVILAEEYQRGGGAAANAIAAWSSINLTTPLPGVTSVVAPEGAAGGSDPQDAETTLRFAPANLRLRDRALTLADFEVLALQFSRDIAQVKAMATPQGMRLVVAMHGQSSRPGRAVIRELRSYLLEHASPMMAADRALDIEGPEEIAIRIDLTLTLDAIEQSGAVAKEARQRLERWLDPGFGGRDKTGWMLGEAPTDSEIAAALTDIKHLEAIERITITRVDGLPLTTLKPSQLARLAADGVTATMRLEQDAGV